MVFIDFPSCFQFKGYILYIILRGIYRREPILIIPPTLKNTINIPFQPQLFRMNIFFRHILLFNQKNRILTNLNPILLLSLHHMLINKPNNSPNLFRKITILSQILRPLINQIHLLHMFRIHNLFQNPLQILLRKFFSPQPQSNLKKLMNNNPTKHNLVPNSPIMKLILYQYFPFTITRRSNLTRRKHDPWFQNKQILNQIIFNIPIINQNSRLIKPMLIKISHQIHLNISKKPMNFHLITNFHLINHTTLSNHQHHILTKVTLALIILISPFRRFHLFIILLLRVVIFYHS